MTNVNFFVRFMVLASLPGAIVFVAWARIKWSLKPQRLKNMEGEERKHLLRLEAESLFDSINDDDDGTLNPAEMRQAINEILGKTSHQAVVLHRAGSRGGGHRRMLADTEVLDSIGDIGCRIHHRVPRRIQGDHGRRELGQRSQLIW